MCLCLINRAQRESLVRLSLCAADFLMSQRQFLVLGGYEDFFIMKSTPPNDILCVCVCVGTAHRMYV